MRQTRRKLGLAARFVNYGAIDRCAACCLSPVDLIRYLQRQVLLVHAALDSRLRGNDEIYIPPPPNSGRRKWCRPPRSPACAGTSGFVLCATVTPDLIRGPRAAGTDISGRNGIIRRPDPGQFPGRRTASDRSGYAFPEYAPLYWTAR